MFDGGLPVDAAPPPDTGPPDAGADGGPVSDAEVDAGSGDAGTTPECGTQRPDLTGTGGSEGLAIGRDGTIYYSVRSGVARIRPGVAAEPSWATIQTGATIWGMVLSADNARLYVGSPTTRDIHAIDTTTGVVTPLTENVGAPNGLTLGPDGAVYASDFGGNRVIRVATDTGAVSVVTTSAIASANGVAFNDSGELLVGSYADGYIAALTLDADHRETSRRMVASDLGAVDGLAVATDGTLLATDQSAGPSRPRLIAVDGAGIATLLRAGLTSPANVEFGTGPLNCTDIYVATGAGVVRYEAGTWRQRAVPWH